MTEFITVVMIFSIPLVAIVTSHLRKQMRIKHEIIKDEIEPEKLKQKNYVLETEKLRLEMKQMELNMLEQQPRHMEQDLA
ncbi:hypothetical protein [Bacillus thermotolerans]|uniref:Uncharacterized protein n=1 Tax=Bacillus thermotolerans TaxID=1221996 RepID=A0A0F5I2V4_BACTR|nr:hypothetical protein [Bacillus thermotolerans]KKB39580.1 hypothetical protein QY95_02210 [Bacillus thermotolerans]